MWMWLLAPLLAAPSLPFVTDAADRRLQVWWQEGELLIGVMTDTNWAGLKPLKGSDPVPMPVSFDGWREIGKECPASLQTEFTLEGQGTFTARVAGPWEHPILRIEQEGRPLALTSLGRPARLCEVVVAQCDGMPGLEVLVSWRDGEGETEIRGLSIFRMPAVLY